MADATPPDGGAGGGPGGSGGGAPARPRGPAMRAVNGIDRVIRWIETTVLAYGVLAMFLNTIGNVIGRFLFNQSLYFSEELNQFLIVLVTFVGLGYATRRGRHIRMSAFYDSLGDKARKALMVIIALSTGIVMFWLSWIAYDYVYSVYESQKVTSALRVPLYLTYLWVPFGFFLTGIQYMLTVVRNLRDRDVWISWEQVDAYEEVDATVAGADQD